MDQIESSEFDERSTDSNSVRRVLLFIWHSIVKYKYVVLVVIFWLILGFFDSHSLYRRFQLWREEQRLRKEIEYYRQEYEQDTRTLEELQTGSDALERAAREKHGMHQPNEDVYITR